MVLVAALGWVLELLFAMLGRLLQGVGCLLGLAACLAARLAARLMPLLFIFVVIFVRPVGVLGGTVKHRRHR